MSQISDARRSNRLPDIIAKDLDVLFCGINPGLAAASAGHHFLGRGNRFWPVLHLAGFTATEISPQRGHLLLEYGCGITSVVSRATASAEELSPSEFAAATHALEHKIALYKPRFLAFLGKAAYAGMKGQRVIDWGFTLVAGGATVAMVGDGINDAPALMKAQVSVAVGSGTDVARESADVVLLGNDLSKLAETLQLARRTRGIIWQNFTGTVVVDLVGMALAAGLRPSSMWRPS